MNTILAFHLGKDKGFKEKNREGWPLGYVFYLNRSASRDRKGSLGSCHANPPLSNDCGS